MEAVIDTLSEIVVVGLGVIFFLRGMWKEHTFSMAAAAAMFAAVAAMK